MTSHQNLAPPSAQEPLVPESITRNAQGNNSSALEGIYSQIFWTPEGMIDEFNPHRRTPLGLDPSIHGPAYVFISRPDLNIGTDEAIGSVDRYLGLGTPSAPLRIRNHLTRRAGNGFIPLLTNTCLSFPHQDITLDTMDMWENWSANKMTLPKDTVSSRQGGQVSLEFQEYTGAPVSLMMRIWVEYIDGVSKGRFYPHEDYLNDRVLDYSVAIYVFLLEPDGFTIEWGSKYTGCFPAAVPGSAFSTNIGGADGVKVSVPFNYSYYETMDPALFVDFNSTFDNFPDSAAPNLSLANNRPDSISGGSDAVRIRQLSSQGGKMKYILEFPRFEGNTALKKTGL